MKRLILLFSAFTLITLNNQAFAASFQSGGYSLEIDTSGCPAERSLRGTLSIPENSLSEDAFNAQDALTDIKDQLIQSCPNLITIQFWVMGPSGRSNSAILARNNWQLPEVQRLETAQAQARAQEYFAYQQSYLDEPAPEEHDLSSYGYYKSKQIARENGATLYLAVKTQNDRRAEYVMLHDGNQEMFEVLPPDPDQTIRIAASYYEMLTRMLADEPLVQRRILHHYRGYHHPTDDRLKVLGPHYSETPILTTQFSDIYERGILKIIEHDRYPGIGFDTDTQRPPVSLSAAIAKFGASAPADGNANEDQVAELGPEGPSDEYLAKRTAERDDLVSRGLIFKDAAFWETFNSKDIKSIFEGRYYSGTGLVGNAALMHYLNLNGSRCEATIENPQRFRVEERTTETDEYGNSSSYTTTLWDMVVPARFLPYLQRNFTQQDSQSSANSIAQDIFDIFSTPLQSQASNLQQNIEWVQNVQGDVGTILNSGDCNSPMKRQLEEMLFHYAAQQDPRVYSQFRLANASELSDSIYERGSATDIATACMAANDFTNSERTKNYCACTQSVMERNAPDRVEAYAKRYMQLRADYYEAKTAVQRGLDHPDIAVFGNLDSTCITVR